MRLSMWIRRMTGPSRLKEGMLVMKSIVVLSLSAWSRRETKG